MTHFLLRQDRNRIIANKLEHGERLTREDRVHRWSDIVDRIDTKIAPLIKAGKLRDAFSTVMCEIAAHAVVMDHYVDKLEDRIAALEPKPRVRRQAPTRPAA